MGAGVIKGGSTGHAKCDSVRFISQQIHADFQGSVNLIHSVLVNMPDITKKSRLIQCPGLFSRQGGILRQTKLRSKMNVRRLCSFLLRGNNGHNNCI